MKFQNIMVRVANAFFRLLPMSRMHNVKCSILRLAGLKIGKNVRIWSTAKFYSPHIEIGDNTFIGFNVQLFANCGGEIIIGRNCALGTDVIIITGSHTPGTPENRTGPGVVKPIRVHDGCRISTRAVLIEGVEVGAGAHIAAGAVVVANVAANTLVGGVPARHIKDLS